MEAALSRQVLTVSQVNRLAAAVLGERLGDIWVAGEVSGLKVYPSGHRYFALKDERSQIAAVCFRFAAQRLKFELADGLAVLAHGRVEVYEPSGRYQLVVDAIEPLGAGARQQAFEQLKRRLEREGLFAAERKRPLPRLPRTVGVVTSPSGAAIHDILRTFRLRQAKVRVLLYPAQVQGEGAAAQIAAGIEALNAHGAAEVIIVGRGGGSIEDLWPFNEEVVARAIAASRVPIVSGVGHEIDFTIADFVADVRAATPTAAAQLVAQTWQELPARIDELVRSLLQSWQQYELSREEQLATALGSSCFELLAAAVARLGLRVEQARARAVGVTLSRLRSAAAALAGTVQRLERQNPVVRTVLGKARLQQLVARLAQAAAMLVRARRDRWQEILARLEPGWQTGFRPRAAQLDLLSAKLAMLSPLASLARGYAICRRPDGTVVSNVGQVSIGEQVLVMLADGSLTAAVQEIASRERPEDRL